jgi:hypothetical protein
VEVDKPVGLASATKRQDREVSTVIELPRAAGTIVIVAVWGPFLATSLALLPPGFEVAARQPPRLSAPM